MSTPTPQEIRDRLARVETVLSDISTHYGEELPTQLAAEMSTAKATVLNAAALTLLVEAQQQANKIAAAQVYASMGQASYGRARAIVEEARR